MLFSFHHRSQVYIGEQNAVNNQRWTLLDGTASRAFPLARDTTTGAYRIGDEALTEGPLAGWVRPLVAQAAPAPEWLPPVQAQVWALVKAESKRM